jgi:hypothetical protein
MEFPSLRHIKPVSSGSWTESRNEFKVRDLTIEFVEHVPEQAETHTRVRVVNLRGDSLPKMIAEFAVSLDVAE